MFNWDRKGGAKIETAEELAKNLAQIKALEARNKELWDELERDLGEGDHSLGDFIIKFSPQARFNEALARSVLSEEEFALICTPRADSTLAKKHFGDRYEQFQKPASTYKKEINRVL